MNYQVDRIAEEAKQMSYEELKAASERILDMLDEMEWDAIVAKPHVQKRLSGLGDKAWQEHLEGLTEEGGSAQLDLEPEKPSLAKKTRKPSKKKARAARRPKKDAQPFDNLVKALFGKDGAQIVPELVEGAQVVSKEVLTAMFAYEEIIQDDPVIQNLLAQKELEGKIEGKIEGLKDSILSFLSIRFSPALAIQAQPAVMSIQDYEGLKRLHRQLIKARDEQTVLVVLDLPDEQSHPSSSNLPTE